MSLALFEGFGHGVERTRKATDVIPSLDSDSLRELSSPKSLRAGDEASDGS